MTTLTSKGQVTIPKHIRDSLGLTPGTALEWGLSKDGEIVLRKETAGGAAKRPRDRFDAVRGSAQVKWRTDELLKLLRSDD